MPESDETIGESSMNDRVHARIFLKGRAFIVRFDGEADFDTFVGHVGRGSRMIHTVVIEPFVGAPNHQYLHLRPDSVDGWVRIDDEA